jgi:hypothetical protein
MDKSIINYNFPVLLALILIASCAKISSPTGGPKDKEPPVIVKSDPVSGQTNFKGKKITITFNEFVALDKINEKFMVSPPMEKKPKVFIKGKSVVIEYEEELKDSTTYTFYFQDAIKDLNEANPIDNYQFVIATGNVIDSLSVTGNVYNAFSLDPPDDALLMLYKDPADSAVIKKLPEYITKAGKTGYFRIDNVKEGIYRLYALKDADNSKNFNLPDEEIAFMDTLVKVSAEKNYIPPVPDTAKVKFTGKKNADTVFVKGEYQLILFKPEKKMHYLTSSSRSMQYKLIYTLSLPPDTIGFDFSIPEASANSYFLEKSKENDTIQVWLTDTALYSESQLTTLIGYPFTDSLGNIVRKQDTVLMRFLVPRSTRAKPKPAQFKVVSGLSTGSLKPKQEIVFKSQTPFRTPDTSKIRVYEIKDTIKIAIPYRLEKDEKNSCNIILHTELRQGKSYLFIADSAAFGNIYGEQSDSTGTKFSVRNEDSFGKLVLNIFNFEGNRIIQLLNSQDKPLREIQTNKDGKTEFPLLDKGLYRLRVIYDLNGDGKWTTGDFLSGRQPEPVSFYFQELDVKENFWLNQDWDISQKNIKKLKNTPGNNPGR